MTTFKTAHDFFLPWSRQIQFTACQMMFLKSISILSFIYDYVFQVVSCPQVSPPKPSMQLFSPHMCHIPRHVLSFRICSLGQYLVRNTHEASHCAVASTPLTHSSAHSFQTHSAFSLFPRCSGPSFTPIWKETKLILYILFFTFWQEHGRIWPFIITKHNYYMVILKMTAFGTIFEKYLQLCRVNIILFRSKQVSLFQGRLRRWRDSFSCKNSAYGFVHVCGWLPQAFIPHNTLFSRRPSYRT